MTYFQDSTRRVCECGRFRPAERDQRRYLTRCDNCWAWKTDSQMKEEEKAKPRQSSVWWPAKWG